jgi:hypothetical protein
MRRNRNHYDPLVTRAKLSHKLIALSIVQVVINQHRVERCADSRPTGSNNTRDNRDRVPRKELAHNISGEYGMILDEKNLHCVKALAAAIC